MLEDICSRYHSSRFFHRCLDIGPNVPHGSTDELRLDRAMRIRKLMLSLALLTLPSVAAAQALPAYTICLTMRMYADGKSYVFPAGTDSAMTEKLSKLGYRPAACNSAQIRLALEVRLSGETEESGKVTITADGTNGNQPAHYQTQMLPNCLLSLGPPTRLRHW